MYLADFFKMFSFLLAINWAVGEDTDSDKLINFEDLTMNSGQRIYFNRVG